MRGPPGACVLKSVPYKEVWLQPPVFLNYRNVKVYHVYKDDDASQVIRTNWYGLSPYCSDRENSFDVRDVASALGMPWPDTREEIRTVLKAAIDRALDGDPESCGRDFAACWAERSSEEFDPLEPVVELMNDELQSALITVLEFCNIARNLDIDNAVLNEMDITDKEFQKAVDLLERLVN